jgi:dTDP-4-amino-4,6-dideoxygalactose transaminase
LTVPFVDLQIQYRELEQTLNVAIQAVLDRGDFVLGSDVEQLEREFAAYCTVSYAVGVDSGLSALELALRAYGIGPGDEVIIPANTFIATALAVSSVGATPVLVDADPVSFNIDVNQIEAVISARTAAIIPVHLYGQPADMDPIVALARRHGLVVIEDACQAHGALYKGRRVGSLGDAAAFSFYPGKNLGAYGDGGMLVTNDVRVYEQVQMLRNYGQRVKYQHLLRGFNKRLDSLQAAILRVKLAHLDGWNAARQRHATSYARLLAATTLALPFEEATSESVWHLYVVRSEDREALRDHLTKSGVACGIHYPIPIHLQEAFHDLGYQRGSFPVSEAYAEQILSLPMYPELNEEQIGMVARSVVEVAPAEQPLRAVAVGNGVVRQ